MFDLLKEAEPCIPEVEDEKKLAGLKRRENEKR